MLILERKAGQTVVINGPAVVTVRSIRGKRVSLGFEAPRDVTISRGELVDPSPLVLHDDGDELPEVRHG